MDPVGAWTMAAEANRTAIAAKRSAKVPMLFFTTFTSTPKKQSAPQRENFLHLLMRLNARRIAGA
jgi:hypothetical protein